MRKAIIIVGDEKRFLDEMNGLRSYLHSFAAVESVTCIQTAYMDAQSLQKNLEIAMRDLDRAQPTLLVYAGHGGSEGWAISSNTIYPYETLAMQLAAARNPMLFINDCCHAFAVAKYLETANVQQSRLGLIASSSAEKLSYQGTTRKICETWRQTTVYQAEADSEIEIGTIESITAQEMTVGKTRHVISYAAHVLFPNRFPAVRPLCLQLHFGKPCVVRYEPRAGSFRWGTTEFDKFFFADRQLSLDFMK